MYKIVSSREMLIMFIVFIKSILCKLVEWLLVDVFVIFRIYYVIFFLLEYVFILWNNECDFFLFRWLISCRVLIYLLLVMIY